MLKQSGASCCSSSSRTESSGCVISHPCLADLSPLTVITRGCCLATPQISVR